MKYTDKVAARIAYFGAIKMDAQGYRIVDTTFAASRARGNANFRVYRPLEEGQAEEDQTFYPVAFVANWHCPCAFRAENCTCKHIVRCQMELRRIKEEAAQAERDAERWDAEADARAEAADAMERYWSR